MVCMYAGNISCDTLLYRYCEPSFDCYYTSLSIVMYFLLLILIISIINTSHSYVHVD